MILFAIDPGSKLSGFVVFDTELDEVVKFGKWDNELVLKLTEEDMYGDSLNYDVCLIEKPDFLSKGAGATVIEAIFWAGRFKQHFKNSYTYGRNFLKKKYKLKNDAAVLAFIKARYNVKLTRDSWQAFLLIHAYLRNVKPIG